VSVSLGLTSSATLVNHLSDPCHRAMQTLRPSSPLTLKRTRPEGRAQLQRTRCKQRAEGDVVLLVPRRRRCFEIGDTLCLSMRLSRENYVWLLGRRNRGNYRQSVSSQGPCSYPGHGNVSVVNGFLELHCTVFLPLLVGGMMTTSGTGRKEAVLMSNIKMSRQTSDLVAKALWD
jgi:hypothetical protein